MSVEVHWGCSWGPTLDSLLYIFERIYWLKKFGKWKKWLDLLFCKAILCDKIESMTVQLAVEENSNIVSSFWLHMK